MTFSSSVKSELYSRIPKSNIKALSEVIAISSILKVVISESVREISFVIENENRNIIEYIKGIFFEYLDIRNVVSIDDNNFFPRDGKYIFTVTGLKKDYFLRLINQAGKIYLEDDKIIDKKSFDEPNNPADAQ